MLNVTNIPAPRVNIIDERTGLISREWYRFFLNLFTLVGQGNNQTSLDDLQVGPPAQNINVIVSGSGGASEVAPPPAPYTSVANYTDIAPPPAPYTSVADYTSLLPPQLAFDPNGYASLTGNNTFSGINTFTNDNNQFLGLTYVTADGLGGQHAYFGENTAYAVIGGYNGVVLASGSTYPGTGRYVGDAVSFRPWAASTYSLGTSAQPWTTIYGDNLSLGGAVTSGVWHGSTIGTAYGGTGASSLTGAGIVTTTDTQTISGAKAFTSNNNQFLGLTYATSDGTSSSAYLGENTGFAVVGGINGVVLAQGSSYPGSPIFSGDTNTWRATVDNTRALGTSVHRYSVVYAATGTINTSDATEKQQVRELSESEQRVAQRVRRLIRAFKWNDAVDRKGDEARIHFGVMAQDVQAAFAAEGLDAAKYGLFCSDTWTTLDGTSQTRLGVRYDELLAFVIAAI